MPISRRLMLAGLAALPVAGGRAALAAPFDGLALGLQPDSGRDQSEALQQAFDRAAAEGRALYLDAGTYLAEGLKLRAGLHLVGGPGVRLQQARGAEPLATGVGLTDLQLAGIGFAGAAGGKAEAPLVALEDTVGLDLDHCSFSDAAGDALALRRCAGLVSAARFTDIGLTGLMSHDAAGLAIRDSLFSRCGSGGVRIWRDRAGFDGTIVSGCRIADTGMTGGGNGQNGNGINLFQADGCIVSGNVISRSAFTAIRVNACRNSQVIGNQCLESGEVAIFSEFGFSGSIIADNLVDMAAAGIAITNFDHGGQVATCSGNIVRRIAPRSAVNPDTRPYGIAAEADAAVSGNMVEDVPGVGIVVGFGPYLRDVSVTGNVVRNSAVGIGVSVVEGAGTALVANNLVSASDRAGIAGLRWTEIASADLEADAAAYPNVTLSGNRVQAG